MFNEILKNSNQFNVGDVYFGTVKKVVPGLNAAFIDIGYEKDAFLHYLDFQNRILNIPLQLQYLLIHLITSQK